ncbi:MAG: caspase family protein [Gemmatimonadota bacterium]|jgi:uncharacterized caspase-like protein
MRPSDRAVVVGITGYPALGDLVGTANDARDFATWLADDAGGGLQDDQISLILSENGGEPSEPWSARPSTTEIDSAFDRIIHEKMEEYRDGWGPTGRLYMFFAGHGLAPDPDDAALLAANSSWQAVGHHIPGRAYANWFRAGAYFEEVILLMDCCRDDYPLAPWRIPPWPAAHRPEGADVRYLFGFATKWARQARARPADDPGEIHGYFTAALLEGLRGAPAAVKDGRVTADSLADYVYNRVREITPRECFQEPEFDRSPDADAIVLSRHETVRPRLVIHLGAGPGPADVALIDGRNRPVALPDPLEGRIEVEVDPGIYLLQVRGEEQFFQVTDRGPRHVHA